MPKSEYFSGRGEKVWADMIRRYGPRKGARVFYATAEARGMRPKRRARRRS